MLATYTELFSALAAEGVAYRVFKGVEHLAEDLEGARGDIDLWVPEADRRRFDEATRAAGFRRVIWSFSRLDACVLLAWDREQDRTLALHAHRHPIAFVKRSPALTVFRYLEQPPAALTETMPTVAEPEWRARFDAARSSITRRAGWSRMRLAAFGGGEVKRLGFRFSLRQSLLSYASYVSRFVFHRGRFPLSRRGLVVVVTGVDGSGKSTVVDALVGSRFLQYTQGTRRRYMGNREFWIPGLERAFSRRKRNAVAEILGVVDRKLRALPIAVHRRLGRVVVCDRFYFDQLVADPTAGRLTEGRVKSWVNRFVRWSPVRPDVWLHLHVEAEVAVARRPELDASTVRAQSAAYLDVARPAGAVVLDAGGAAEVVAASARDAVSAAMLSGRARTRDGRS